MNILPEQIRQSQSINDYLILGSKYQDMRGNTLWNSVQKYYILMIYQSILDKIIYI